MEHGLDYQRVKQIFLDSLTIAESDRAAEFVGQQCAGEQHLKMEVERLIRAHQAADTWLDAADRSEHAQQDVLPLVAGQEIDRYVIRQLIGEGGMGLVYLAEQQTPVRRSVAIKVIKPGLDTRELLARFRFEQQALAQLNHPLIAQVLDAGSTPDGYPYFVMELVRGQAVTEFCRKSQTDLQGRLQLFRQICSAVSHAHQRGIIHRDLKPGNILAWLDEGAIRLKVIDFGVAKLVRDQSSLHVQMTRVASLLGTPDYMSPEQKNLDSTAVDTRSDVYSLGVILYELLTGHVPHESHDTQSNYQDAHLTMPDQRAITRPSQVVGSCKNTTSAGVSQPASCNCREGGRSLPGDLDWIVLKALEWEPGRRYQSVVALSDDISRFLGGEAIEARPPSSWYRLKKSVVKHRIALCLLSTIVIAALSIAGVSWRSARATARSEARAVAMQRAAERAEADTHALLYASDMRLAAEAFRKGDASEAAALLRRHDPGQGPKTTYERDDPRGLEWYYLNCLVAGSRIVYGNQAALFALCPSISGGRLAIAGADSAIRLVDPVLPQVEDTLEVGFRDVAFLEYNPNSKQLAAASRSGTISIWHLASRERLTSIRMEAGTLQAVKFSPDGLQLFAGSSSSGSIQVFDAASGHRQQAIETNHPDISSLALSPEGRWLVCGSSDNHSSLVDLAEPAVIAQSGSAKYRVTCVAYDPQDKFWIDANVKGRVRLIDSSNGQTINEISLPSAVQSLAISPSGHAVAVGCRSGVLHVLPIDKMRESPSSTGLASYSAHIERVTDVAWLTPDSIASVSRDGSLALTEYRQSQPHSIVIDKPAQKVSVSRSGRWIAAHDLEHVYLLDTHVSKKPVLAAVQTDSHWAGMTFTNNESELVVASADGHLAFVSVAEPNSTTTERISPGIDFGELRFSANGKRLLAFSRADDLALVLDYPSLHTVFQCPCPDAYTGALSPDGTKLVTSYQGDVMLYDIDTGDMLKNSQGHHSETTNDLRFSPDGQYIVTTSDDRTIRIWFPFEGRPAELVGIHPGGVPRSVAISSDGRTLITSSKRGQIWAWNVASRQKLMPIAISEVGYARSVLAANDSVLVMCDQQGRVEWIEFGGP